MGLRVDGVQGDAAIGPRARLHALQHRRVPRRLPALGIEPQQNLVVDLVVRVALGRRLEERKRKKKKEKETKR